MFNQETPDPSRPYSLLSESSALKEPDPSPLAKAPHPSSVGPFSIVETLGSGAMGEVYLARDERLDRWVALKRVQPAQHGAEAVARFRREARAAAKLHHRSIVQIHDLLETEESDWLVMERLEGEMLTERLSDGPMEPLDAIHVAKRIAEGLAVAHAAGVMHRDLKAANIMLTPNGVKILDFGLAKSLPGHGAKDETGVTAEGQLIGTIAAMAPEQAKGLVVDERADLFALGILLYEMLTGASPFKRRSALATMNAICDAPIEKLDEKLPDLPTSLVQLVHDLLAKQPDDRPPGGAIEVVDRLRLARAELGGSASSYSSSVLPPRQSLSRAWRLVLVLLALFLAWVIFRLVTPEPPSVARPAGPLKLAVSPFRYSGLESHRFFAQGLSEEIRSRLTTLDDVLVISRLETSSGEALRGAVPEPPTELEADFALDGTVSWPSDNGIVTVALQLTRLEDGIILWQERFEERPDEILALQASLASDVASQLPIEIGEIERQAMRLQGTFSQAAYLAYLEGLDWERRSRFASDSLEQALAAYRRAAEEDEFFVDAHARAIRFESLDYLNRARSPETASEIKRHLLALKKLAPGLPATRLAAAEVAYRVEGDHDQAIEELRAVLEMEPNNREALATFGFVLRRQGRFAEAIKALEHAFILSPFDASLPAFIAETYRGERRFERALEWYHKSLKMFPSDGWTRGQAALSLFELSGCQAVRCDGSEAFALLDQAPNPEDESIRLHRFWLQVLLSEDHDVAALEAALEQLPAGGRFQEAAFDRISLPSRVAVLQLLGRVEQSAALVQRHRSALEDAIVLDLEYPANHSFLAFVLALERDPESAAAAQHHAAAGIALAQPDQFSGPKAKERWAMALALSGQSAEALPLVRDLLATSYQRSITRQSLRLDPIWAPLRQSPEASDLIPSY